MNNKSKVPDFKSKITFQCLIFQFICFFSAILLKIILTSYFFVTSPDLEYEIIKNVAYVEEQRFKQMISEVENKFSFPARLARELNPIIDLEYSSFSSSSEVSPYYHYQYKYYYPPSHF